MEKIKQFLKKNWAIIIIGVLVVFLAVSLFRNYTSNNLYESLMEQYSSQKAGFEKQIKELESINKAKEQQKAEQEKLYRESLTKIEDQYKADVKSLNKRLTRQRDILVVQGNENPNFLVDKLSEFYRIEKYEGKLEKCVR